MSLRLYDFSDSVALRMESLLISCDNFAEFRRIQAIYFRARYNESAKQISERIGIKIQTVRNLHSAWMKHGEASLIIHSKGGRYREYLTKEQELSLIEQHRKEAESGGILEISNIKNEYEKIIGKIVVKSTIYRMLARHGWRKISPRPKHPKADKEKQETFKKTGQE
jgi:transposase